ncbi:MAG: phosphoribulokinase [Gammaproteobacteria bacterium]
MSRKHPIVAVTGSSGAGTTTVKQAFDHIFLRERITPAVVEGDSFHRYDRSEMHTQLQKAEREHRILSHFGPEGNLIDELATLFRIYGESGTGRMRHYVHTQAQAALYDGVLSGEFTPWEDIPAGTDLLFYDGLHGGIMTETVNVAKLVDVLIGVAPTVNLEWIQKIHRDKAVRGYSQDQIVDTILRRMYDYVNYITPQFSRTDINFQRVPTVDTSNPFVARDIPTLDESFVIIRFRDPVKFGVDFPHLLNVIQNSFMSRRNTIVVPGGKMGLAIELIMAPVIADLMVKRFS